MSYQQEPEPVTEQDRVSDQGTPGGPYGAPAPGPYDAGAPGSYGARVSGALAAPGMSKNPAGKVSLGVGVALVLVGLAQQMVSYALPYLMQMSAFGAGAVSTILLPFTITTALLALVACIAGGMGLRHRNAPRAAAGAGLALGVSALLATLVGLFGPLIFGAMA